MIFSCCYCLFTEEREKEKEGWYDSQWERKYSMREKIECYIVKIEREKQKCKENEINR